MTPEQKEALEREAANEAAYHVRRMTMEARAISTNYHNWWLENTGALCRRYEAGYIAGREKSYQEVEALKEAQKGIAWVLDLAQADLRSCYAQLGYKNSNVLRAIDDLLSTLTPAIDDVAKSKTQ